MFATSLVTAISLIATAAAPHAAKPERLSPAQADSVTRAILADRHDTEESLRSGPTSYFATVLRVDFGAATTLTVGRAADCGVRIDDPAMPEHALAVSVQGDSFRVEGVDTTTFTWRKLAYHAAELPPAAIQLGRWTLRLSHQRFPAIIVFDPKSPRYSLFHGLEYFPVDLRWRYRASLTAAEHPDTVIILSTRGNERRAVRVGWFDLDMAGHAVRLEAHRLLEPGVDEQGVSLFFRDATTGKETYSVGRYVDPERLDDGTWRIDFNQAYNPACAFSPHYNCPIPSRANTLPFAVRAGEKDAHYVSH